MADNTVLDAGAGGDTIATDDIGGVKYPRSKMVLGADGSNDGDVSATNPMPVKGTGTAGTANTGVVTVQGIASMTPVLATLSGTNNIATVTTVTTVSAVTAISNALPAGTNNIGDVDVLTVPADPFGANADAASATGSISAKLRFIASTGIPITGTVTVGSHAVTNAGTFAVQAAQSGTWTVDLGATDNAVLDAIAASLAGTLTVGSHAVTNAGTFAVQVTGDALTALQTLDNCISGNEAQVDVVTQPARAATTDTITAKIATDTIQAGTTALTPKFAKIDAASSGDNTLVAAVASNKIRVLALFLVAAGTVSVRLESGASGTALTGQMDLVANSGFVLPFNPVGWCETGVNTLLNLELSGAVSVDGCLTYVEVP